MTVGTWLTVSKEELLWGSCSREDLGLCFMTPEQMSSPRNDVHKVWTHSTLHSLKSVHGPRDFAVSEKALDCFINLFVLLSGHFVSVVGIFKC